MFANDVENVAEAYSYKMVFGIKTFTIRDIDEIQKGI